MRFVAIQIGARRNYAIPGILEQAGMLEHFYTDICSDVGLGRFLSRGKSLPFVGEKLQRLAVRRLPLGVAEKTTTFTLPLIKHGLGTSFTVTDGARLRAHVRWTDAIGNAITRRGFGAATHVYSTFGEGVTALASARQLGLRVITEIYILLSSDSIVAAERRRFPDWEPVNHDYEKVSRELRTELAMLSNTDIAICPAQSVRDDLVQHFGFPEERTIIVPYGVDREWLEIENRPIPGRILFAGSACLRKGIHYLAMAAELLARRGLRYMSFA